MKPPTKKQRELHNVRLVFKRMGGVNAMTEWAEKNPGEFYTKIYSKIIPRDIVLEGNPDNPVVIQTPTVQFIRPGETPAPQVVDPDEFI